MNLNQGEIDESGHLNRFRNQKKIKTGPFIKASDASVAQSIWLAESTGLSK
jgi:hypothetical protein